MRQGREENGGGSVRAARVRSSLERYSMGILVENVSKSYNGRTLLEDVSLDVRDGDFVTCLGPTGSAKTTLLRIMAGVDKNRTRARAMGTRKQLGVGARKTIMARHQRMPTSKAGYTCAVEPTVVKQITCIEEESIYALVQCTTPSPQCAAPRRHSLTVMS